MTIILEHCDEGNSGNSRNWLPREKKMNKPTREPVCILLRQILEEQILLGQIHCEVAQLEFLYICSKCANASHVCRIHSALQTRPIGSSSYYPCQSNWVVLTSINPCIENPSHVLYIPLYFAHIPCVHWTLPLNCITNLSTIKLCSSADITAINLHHYLLNANRNQQKK